MKKQLLIVLAIVVFAAVAVAQPGKHLFILSGQSNMARLDPTVSFIPAVKEKFGAENVIVAKDALGAQPIRRWCKTPLAGETGVIGDLYDRLMRKVHVAIQDQKIQTVTLVWMQGERDALEKLGEVYAARLNELRNQIEEDLGKKEIYLVLGRISDCNVNKERRPHWGMIRDVQVEVAETDPLTTWVDTDDLNGDRNGIHYTTEGYRILGERFAEAAIELIKENDSE